MSTKDCSKCSNYSGHRSLQQTQQTPRHGQLHSTCRDLSVEPQNHWCFLGLVWWRSFWSMGNSNTPTILYIYNYIYNSDRERKCFDCDDGTTCMFKARCLFDRLRLVGMPMEFYRFGVPRFLMAFWSRTCVAEVAKHVNPGELNQLWWISFLIFLRFCLVSSLVHTSHPIQNTNLEIDDLPGVCHDLFHGHELSALPTALVLLRQFVGRSCS